MHLLTAGSWSSYLNEEFTSIRDNPKKQLVYLYFDMAVYMVWTERNVRCHNSGPTKTGEQVAMEVKRMARERVSSSSSFQKKAREDFTLVASLY